MNVNLLEQTDYPVAEQIADHFEIMRPLVIATDLEGAPITVTFDPVVCLVSRGPLLPGSYQVWLKLTDGTWVWIAEDGTEVVADCPAKAAA